MKKILFAALLTASIATSAFAIDAKKVNYRTQENFYAEFKEANNVDWTVKPTFAKATFTMDGENVEAFFSSTGDILGTSRKISIDNLPVSAKRAFAKKYAGYTVNEAIKFDGVDEVAYYISAETNDQSVILKVSENNAVSVFQKVKKN